MFDVYNELLLFIKLYSFLKQTFRRHFPVSYTHHPFTQNDLLG